MDRTSPSSRRPTAPRARTRRCWRCGFCASLCASGSASTLWATVTPTSWTRCGARRACCWRQTKLDPLIAVDRDSSRPAYAQPEWYLAHAVAMLRDHSLFLAEDVQPILSEAGLPMYSAKVGRNTLLCSSASVVLSYNGSWRESSCWSLGRVCPTNGRHCDGAAARGLARANGPTRSDDPHRPRGVLLAWPACPLRNFVRYSQVSARSA